MSSLTQEQLNKSLWAAADDMRKSMSADDYKDYLLGLVFFKNLSDEILYEVVDLVENRKPESLDEAQRIFERYYLSEDKDLLEEEIRKKFGCFIKPESTFSHLAQEVENRTFMLSSLSQIFRDIEQSQGLFYEGLFEDFDINSKKLGKTAAEANKLISSVITQLADIDFHAYGHDALGDAYEYLISISGTPVVVKHFRIKFFFSLAKQDLFPYFFGCLGILFEVKCVCCCIQKRPIYQSLQAVSRTSIDSICLP